MYVQQWDVATLSKLLKIVDMTEKEKGAGGLTELHLPHSQLEGVGPERGIYSSHRTSRTPLQARV